MKRSPILDTEFLILTGAGASVPLGLPQMSDFVTELGARVPEEHRDIYNDLRKAYKPYPDLEQLLDAVRKYNDFYKMMFGDPLVGWPGRDSIPDPELVKRSHAIDLGQKGALPGDYGYEGISAQKALAFQNLERLLLDLVFEKYGSVDDNAAITLYEPLLSLLEQYFSQNFIPIFTTNYDPAIEVYCEATKTPFEWGFERTPTETWWRPSRFELFESEGEGRQIVLFKLHGSLTWYRKDSRTMYSSLVVRDPKGYQSAVVYPTQTKEYQNEEPFKTAYHYLFRCLESAKVAIIIGYGLRDIGIRNAISEALDVNSDLQFVLIRGPATEVLKDYCKQNLRSYAIVPYRFETGAQALYYKGLCQYLEQRR